MHGIREMEDVFADEISDLAYRTAVLRDHFAGLAMAALLGTEMHANTDSDIISGWAYAQADSMIRAREAGQ